MISRTFSLAVITALLIGCGSIDPIPQDTFYRLTELSSDGTAAVSPWTEGSVVIKRIRASGIYKDRALAVLKNDGVSLVQSNYHYWNDSPEIMVQRRVFEHAVRSGIASHVSLEMTEDAAYLVTGRLLRFERVDTDGEGAGVAVELLLGVTPIGDETGQPFERTLKFSDTTESADINEAVKKIAGGLDSLITQFIAEASSAISAVDTIVDKQ